MTHGGFGSDPFGGAPFGHNPFGTPPPVISAPTPPQPPAAPKTNTLATLSVVFAFVFAPAGAVLGHLGLREIRRTGELGRRRAIVGIALSYTVIVVAVVAVVIASVLPQPPKPRPAKLFSSSDLYQLVVPFDRVKTAMGDDYLVDNPPTYVARGSEGTWVPNSCAPSIYAGTVWVYQNLSYRAIYQKEAQQPGLIWGISVIQAVAVFADADADAAKHAFSQYGRQLAGCFDHTLTETAVGREAKWTISSLDGPKDGLLTQTSTSALGLTSKRAVAVRSNVLVDVSVAGPHVGDQAVQFARAILDNIGN